MRKTIATVTLCSVIFSTSFAYCENQQVDLEKELTENREEQLRLDEQIIQLNSKIKEVEERISFTNEEISKLDLQINDIEIEITNLENNNDLLANLKEELHQAQVQAEEQKKLMQKIKEEIEEKCVNIYIKIGADGKLFGHVTTKQIVEEFENQTGIHLDKRKVSLPVEINALGVYIAVVDLHKEIKANLEINVLEK